MLSVCASKAMVHCICTCDTQLWHIILYLWLYYRPVDQELSRNFLDDPSRTQVGHSWNRLLLAYTTHTYAIQHNKQSSIPALKDQLTTSTWPEKINNEVTRITIDCDECSTYWQYENTAKKTLPPSFVTSWITLRKISLQKSNQHPDPAWSNFFKNEYPNPILIRKNRKYPAGYPILILSMLTYGRLEKTVALFQTAVELKPNTLEINFVHK